MQSSVVPVVCDSVEDERQRDVRRRLAARILERPQRVLQYIEIFPDLLKDPRYRILRIVAMRAIATEPMA